MIFTTLIGLLANLVEINSSKSSYSAPFFNGKFFLQISMDQTKPLLLFNATIPLNTYFSVGFGSTMKNLDAVAFIGDISVNA